jgi:hypothetical protein
MIDKLLLTYIIVYFSVLINVVAKSWILKFFGCKERIFDIDMNFYFFGSKPIHINQRKYDHLKRSDYFYIALIPQLANLSIVLILLILMNFFLTVEGLVRFVTYMTTIVNVIIFSRKIFGDVLFIDTRKLGDLSTKIFSMVPLFIFSILLFIVVINLLLTVTENTDLKIYGITILILVSGFLIEKLIELYIK